MDEDHVVRVARVLQSLKTGLEHLHGQRTIPDSPPHDSQRFFPSVTSFQENGHRVHFKYLRPLEDDAACVTFLCETLDTHRSVVVKFAETYGQQAHESLASQGKAPQLLYVGPLDPSDGAPSYGHLKLIVMDYVEGKTVAMMMMTDRDRLPSNLVDQVKRIVESLHSAGYVYGDLRPANIMVTSQGKTVLLIDLDWAGTHGEAKYPIAVSSRGRHSQVVGLGTIEKEHDIFMLEELARYLQLQ